MKLLILSDLHGNLSALEAVLDRASAYKADAAALLGDLIDYGMRSNEVVEKIAALSLPIVCNIFGNHEHAVVNDAYERFSSERGRQCARYTKSILSEKTLKYLKEKMLGVGRAEFCFGGKSFLAVHGSIADEYWKSIDVSGDLSGYEKYDVVLSGHSHLPHFFEKYFKADDPEKRNKKKVIFINPGSVGQPRNLNSFAQFALFDTASEEIRLEKVEYDIAREQSFYCGAVDDFYKDRLKKGV